MHRNIPNRQLFSNKSNVKGDKMLIFLHPDSGDVVDGRAGGRMDGFYCFIMANLYSQSTHGNHRHAVAFC